MSAPDVTIFVRHGSDCRYRDDEGYKGCKCRKHLRWSLGGKQYRTSAKTRAWSAAEDAKRRLVDQLSGKKPEIDPAANVQTIRAAFDAFMIDREVSEISAESIAQYRLQLNRFVSWMEGQGAYTIDTCLQVQLLTSYKATWPAVYPSSNTRKFAQTRLRVFLRFCHNAGWLVRVPKMSPVTVDEPETQPLTEAEYQRLLAAVPVEYTNGTAARTTALIKLMRWSGLAIRDASGLRVDELLHSSKNWYHIVKDRQKTGVHCYIPIPKDVAEGLLSLERPHPDYFFWNPKTAKSAQVNSMNKGQTIIKVFKRAGIVCEGAMVTHRLRDTFAVYLLEKGVPMEEVSKLLGHKSIATTEKHYAKWSKGRQDRVDRLVTGTWKT